MELYAQDCCSSPSLLLVSGMAVSDRSANHLLSLQLMADYVTGLSGDCCQTGNIARCIVAGTNTYIFSFPLRAPDLNPPGHQGTMLRRDFR